MKRLLTKGVLVPFILFAGLQADAQVYPYFVDFESDSIKAYASAASVTLNGIKWTLPGVYLGDMEPSDRKHGLHAARVRLTGNTTGDRGMLIMEEDLTKGIDTVYFYHAMYGSETDGELEVFYSTDQGNNWIQAGGVIKPGRTLERVAVPIRTSAPARISIRKKDAASTRINIDDIMITGYNGYATNLILTDKTPVGNNVLLSTGVLELTFNEPITKGTGNIVLHNKTDATSQTIDVMSIDVKVTGVSNSAYVSGFTLGSGKHYYVKFDKDAFASAATTSRKSTGIDDETTWTFRTIDTTTPPGLLSETFSNCAAPDFIGQFRAVSVSGSQQWRCGDFGHGDDYATYMNGGFSGGANDNEDWLITTAKIDLAAVSNPALDFWTKVRFMGRTTKQVLISTDYSGTGSPVNATWRTVKDLTDDVFGDDWVPYSNISLNDYKTAPFYLAFKYVSVSATGAAQEWSIDDVVVKPWFPESVTAYDDRDMDIKVLGMPDQSRIILSVSLTEATTITFGVYDLAGRKVCEQNAALQSGNNVYAIDGLNLHPGMYLVRVSGGRNSGTVKAVVQ